MSKPNLKFLDGDAGAPGIGIGHGVIVYSPTKLKNIPQRIVKEPNYEIDRFLTALQAAKADIQALSQQVAAKLSPEEQALFLAYLDILDSRSFVQPVIKNIEQGQWAEGALAQVVKHHIEQFELLEDTYLRSRAADIRDLGERVLAHLYKEYDEWMVYPKRTILIGDEIPASLLPAIPDGQLMGIMSTSNAANSHMVVLARAMNIPVILGLDPTLITHLDGKAIILDGYQSRVYIEPSKTIRKELRQLILQEREFDEDLQKIRELPAQTTDNHTIKLCINSGLATDIEQSLNTGADGVGLYRTEIPFMIRNDFPDEVTQTNIYRQLLTIFTPKPVVMRTLDVGGDKPLPYFNYEEANPFLGWRGIRFTLDNPEVFITQARAMLRANIGLNNLSIMLPMINGLDELNQALSLIKQAYQEVSAASNDTILFPKVGVMIEVPAVVYQIREIAKQVDFISVGSNDLTQYLLAIDRNNPRVAKGYNYLHPAVLQALKMIVDGAHAENKPVSICGEMASDPIVTVVLLAMKFDMLSISANALLRIKWVVRQFSLAQAEKILNQILSMDVPDKIKVYLETKLEENNLGKLIRAGK